MDVVDVVVVVAVVNVVDVVVVVDVVASQADILIKKEYYKHILTSLIDDTNNLMCVFTIPMFSCASYKESVHT